MQHAEHAGADADAESDGDDDGRRARRPASQTSKSAHPLVHHAERPRGVSEYTSALPRISSRAWTVRPVSAGRRLRRARGRHHDFRQIALHRRAHQEARNRQARDRARARRRAGCGRCPAAASHQLPCMCAIGPLTRLHVDARVRRVVETEDVLERRQEEDRLDRLHEQIRAAAVELLELLAAHDVRHVLGRDLAGLEDVPDRRRRAHRPRPRSSRHRQRPVAALGVDDGPRAPPRRRGRSSRDRAAPPRCELREQREQREPSAASRRHRQRRGSRGRVGDTGLRSVPMLEISTSTVSPGFIQTGGLRPAPTPPGVPVTMTSPGSSCVERRAVLDELRHVEAELADALVLHDGAVQARRQRELARIGDLVRRHEPRAERAARVEVLARRELRRMPLEVAHAAVVEAAIARDVVERAFAG